MREEGEHRSGGRRNIASVAVAQVRIPNQTLTPRRGSCPLSLDIHPSPRGDLCTDERKWVTYRESISMSRGLKIV